MRLTERETIQYLQDASDRCAPLRISRLQPEVSLPEGYRVGAIINFSIQDGPSFEAVAEIAPVATPQNILKRALQLADYFGRTQERDRIPMVVAPYMGAKQGRILADKGISWIDLSGNMLVRVSNRVYIERTGKKNRFPDTAPIKKIFQGTSALVSRALLLAPQGFLSVKDLCNFINAHNANITLSTVSKVLKSLEQELLITKSEGRILATDAERLLNELSEGYKNSTERRTRNAYKFAIDNIQQLSAGIVGVCKDYLACGFYAAQLKGLAVTDKIEIVVKDIDRFRRKAEEKLASVMPDAEFGNATITESSDPGVWFNASFRVVDSVVDDIELYLEMTVDTPRGLKIAEALKKRILEKADSD